MIANRIYEWARTQPEKTALFYNDFPISYASFACSIERLRRILENYDLPAGRTAIIVATNIGHAWAALLALRLSGLTTICVSSMAVAERLRIKDVACLVTTRAEQALLPPKSRAFPAAKTIVLPLPLYTNEAGGDLPAPDRAGVPHGGHVLYTSGTTGHYKKVELKAATEGITMKRVTRIMAYRNDTIGHMVGYPLCTTAGYHLAASIWHVGGTVVIDERVHWQTNFFRHGVNASLLVPSLLAQLLQTLDRTQAPARAFALTIGGGAPSARQLETVFARLTKNVVNIYGATECLEMGRSEIGTIDDFFWLTPTADRTVEIIDETGRECPIETEGELRILLEDGDATEYMDDEEASASVFREGYFYTGDLAVRRTDGRIRILGRNTDVLNIRGFKVPAAYIEQQIQNALKLGPVCVFSRQTQDGNNELAVFIEAEEAPSQATLDALTRDDLRLRAFEKVQFKVLDRLPRTEAGMQKIDRRELRKLAFASDAARP